MDGIKVVRVQHPKAKAAISLFGGHVLSFVPANSADLLWLSENVDLSGNKPLRGGIPICWPWFGKAAEPAHGFVRNAQWTLSQHRENEAGVIVSLTLKDNDDTRRIWPYQFSVELQVEVSSSLRVNLICTNTSNEKFAMGGALHSYFNIANIKDTQVAGLGKEYYELKVKHTTNDVAVFEGEVDRIYTKALPTNVISDPANQRTIEVNHIGNNSVVVWNPWIDIATAMADMTNDGYETMVCVESALYDNQLILEAGQSHTLGVEIKTAVSG